MTAPTQDQATTTVMPDAHTGGMVALVPTAESAVALAVAGGLPAADLHLTLCYLGDDVTTWPPPVVAAVTQAARELTDPIAAAQETSELDDDEDSGSEEETAEALAGLTGPLTLTVFAWSQFNPTGGPDGQDPCVVYQFSGDQDYPQVVVLAEAVQEEMREAMGEAFYPPQYPVFTPHVTAGYGLAPTALTYTGPVVFDRLRVALADRVLDFPLGGDMPMTAAVASPVQVIADTGTELRVRFPVFALEGVDTSDNLGSRYITPGALTNRALPMSLLGQPYSAHGGQDPPPAEVIGNITTLTRHPGPTVKSPRTGKPYGSGVWVWSAEGGIDGTHKYADLVRKQYLRGVSVDLAAVDADLVDDDVAALSEHPRRRVIVNGAEIAAATMVPIPAFGDAYCELADEPTAPEPLVAGALPAGMLREAQPAWRSPDVGDIGGFLARTPSGAVTAKARMAAKKAGHTLPGTDSFPIVTATDLDNAIRRAGSAKDPVKARKFIMSEARRLTLTHRIPDTWNTDGTVKNDKAMTAAGVSTRPPLACFTDPCLAELTPITIEDIPGSPYRHVYGHIGDWTRPHIGFGGRQVYIPRSKCDYAEFMRGGFRVNDNGTPRIVAVGHLTMDTGHADMGFAAQATAHHYDHTGYAWADVAAGDDRFGPWVNGVVRPMVTDEQLDRALASSPSGDWRPIGGGLELVAVLCVNTPGFGVYRARVASGQIQAMVASSGPPPRGVSTAGPAMDYDRFADVIADRILIRQQRHASLASMRVTLLTELDDTPARVAELLEQIPDDDPGSFTTLRGDVLASFLAGRELTPKDAANTARLKEYWAHGPGAAKIGWGAPGDFNRCRTQLAKYVPPGKKLDGLCSNLHFEALGVRPGQEHKK